MNVNDPKYRMLRDNVTQLVNLTDEEFHEAARYFYPRRIKKREHWLMQGEFCTEVIFITKGCLRYYHSQNGAERSLEFLFEDCWFTDFESWLLKRPSLNGVDALEDTEIMVIPFRDLQLLYDKNPKCDRIGRLIAEKTIIEISNNYNSLLSNSPAERYQKLILEKPQLIDRIPQHFIASYLGIEPESLSRIRKKLMLKEAF
jgi:CRP-like cAMP-binding protein